MWLHEQPAERALQLASWSPSDLHRVHRKLQIWRLCLGTAPGASSETWRAHAFVPLLSHAARSKACSCRLPAEILPNGDPAFAAAIHTALKQPLPSRERLISCLGSDRASNPPSGQASREERAAQSDPRPRPARVAAPRCVILRFWLKHVLMRVTSCHHGITLSCPAVALTHCPGMGFSLSSHPLIPHKPSPTKAPV